LNKILVVVTSIILAPLAAYAEPGGTFAAAEMAQARVLILQMQLLSDTLSKQPPANVPGAPAANDTAPIGIAFKALGPAGTQGRIDGPLWKGDGKYRVIANEPYRLHVVAATGFLDGEIILCRDQATGKTTMSFIGKLWNLHKDEWGKHQDVTNNVIFEYNPQKDAGRLHWQEKGNWKHERFEGGKSGNHTLIDFNSHGHHFYQK
jgi:hypothetical protein